MQHNSKKQKIGLFVTCLVDSMRPQIAAATVILIEQMGHEVVVPTTQACCGQPAWNSGDEKSALRVAEQWLSSFNECDCVVVPSGSCAGMITHHLVELFRRQNPSRVEEAAAVAAKTFELSQFLAKENFTVQENLEHAASWTYHDSCSSLREMQVREAPRQFLRQKLNQAVTEMANRDSCCGFGGLFCLKYDEISATMVDVKCNDATAIGVQHLIAGDLGCLLNIAGRAKHCGQKLNCHHYAEVLAFGLHDTELGGG